MHVRSMIPVSLMSEVEAGNADRHYARDNARLILVFRPLETAI